MKGTGYEYIDVDTLEANSLPMNINIKATGFDLTPAISEYVQKKIGSLEKYVSSHEGATFHVEVGKTTNRHKTGEIFKAEVKAAGSGLDQYAVSEAEDLYAAIDILEAELRRELLHQKGKRMELLRRGQRAIKDMMRGIRSFRRKP